MAGFFRWLYGGSDAIQPTAASTLALQSSSQGYPIPILYGKTKITGNLIWYGDFTAIAHEESVGKGGGQSYTTYTYTTGVMFGLVEGETVSYGAAWTTEGQTSVSALGFAEFYGSPSQNAWSNLTVNHPSAALNYKNFSYLANAAYDLKNSPSLPQLWFEANGTTPIALYQPSPIIDQPIFNPIANEFWSGVHLSNPITINRYSNLNSAYMGLLTLNNYFSVGRIPTYVVVGFDYDETCVWVETKTQGGGYVETCLYKLNATTGAEITHRLFSGVGTSVDIRKRQSNSPTGGYYGYKGALVITEIDGYNTYIGTYVLDKSSLSTITTMTASGFTLGTLIPQYSYLDNAGYGWEIRVTGSYPSFVYILIKWDYGAGTGTLVFTFDAPCSLMGLDPTRNNLVIAGNHFISGGNYLFNTATLTYGATLTPNQDFGDGYGDLSCYDSHRDWFWFTGFSNGDTHPTYTAFDLATNNQAYYVQSTLTSSYYPLITSVDDTYPFIWSNEYNFGLNVMERIYPEYTGDDEPAHVIEDFLTNSRYGAGFPIARLDNVTLRSASNSYAAYTNAQGIGFSMVITQSTPARDLITNWLTVTNTAVFWSEGKLKFVPFGDVTIVGLTTTYVPNNTVQYQLGDSDFISELGNDPIRATRPDSYDCYNSYTLNVLDRDNQYNIAVVNSQDQASIDEIGLRVASTINANFISSPATGRLCVELLKNRGLYVRNHYIFKLAWEYALLEPMDIVSLTQSDMGLNNFPVRILTITEDAEGILEIEAEEFLEGVQYAPSYVTQNPLATPVSGFTPPTNTFPPVIFEPPYQVVQNTGGQIWMAVGGESGTWGGCQIWASIDGGITYNYLTSTTGGSTVGTLTATLPTYGGANPDNTNTLSIDVTTSGTMQYFSTADAQNYVSLCYVDGELLSFQSPLLTGAGLYDLTTLYRGAYGSEISAHASGGQFAQINKNVFKFTMPSNFATGQVMYIKLPAYNVIGNALQDLSTVSPILYTITNVGRQAPITFNPFVSGTPAVTSAIYTFIAPYDFRLPTNLVGTNLSIGTNPSSTVVFDVDKNGIAIGTISVSSLGVVTLSSTQTDYATGDTLSIVTPANLYTISNIAFQLAGNKL